jgi:pilus assembly protein TadC
MQSILSYIGMLMLPSGIWFLAGGIARLRTVLYFLSLSKTTTGKIVDLVHDYDFLGQQAYLPVVEFQLKEKEQKIRFQSNVGDRREPSVKIGETIGVRYLPEKPEIARINTTEYFYSDATQMIVGGIICTLVALFLLGKLAPGYAFIGFAILSVGFFVFSFIAKLAIVKRLQPNDNQVESPNYRANKK